MNFRAIVKTTAWARRCARKTMSTGESNNLASLSTKGGGGGDHFRFVLELPELNWNPKIKILWNSSSGRSKVLATQQKRLQVVTMIINSYSVGSLHILAPSDFAIASIIIIIILSTLHFSLSASFLLIIIISSWSSYLRLKSTHYKFSDSGAASHLVLPVLLLVMSSLSFRLV